MRKFILFLVFVFFVFSFLNAGDFQKALRDYRKNTIEMCAQLQNGKPKESREQLLKEIDALILQWEELKKEFASNPPDKFKNDPAWKSYFVQVEENTSVVKSFVEKEKYKSAVRFCGMNCKLFVSMYEVNGIETLSGMLFSLRDTAKSIKAMVDAGNLKGAVKKVEQFKKIFGAINEKYWKDTKDEKIIFFIKAADEFNKSLKNDKAEINEILEKSKEFMSAFAPVYFESL